MTYNLECPTKLIAEGRGAEFWLLRMADGERRTVNSGRRMGKALFAIRWGGQPISIAITRYP